MDAMFYIQASTKQQASYIFSTLSPKPTAKLPAYRFAE